MVSCWIKGLAAFAILAVAATTFGLLYTELTGNAACVGDLCLKDKEDLSDLVDTANDLNLTDITLTDVKDAGYGFIEKINGIDWPDFGFKYDDVFSFDDPRPRPDGRGNETLIGWPRPSRDGDPLTLTISNALTPDWDEYFVLAIADWEGEARVDGDAADVLELTTEDVAADPGCTPIEGIMKVCNDDYGNTGWKGLNEALIQGNVIIASVAKMNEYYLGLDKYSGVSSPSTLQEQRRYTMCHEIGHGFGLSHQDEEFGNPDLNTCMDYSDSPGVNLLPNSEDYHALNVLYGDGVNGQAGEQTGTGGRLLRGQRRTTTEFGVDFGGRKVEKRTFYMLA